MPVWALGLWCETPAASGPSGFHTTTRELQTCTLEAPALQNTTKIPREDPQRDTNKSEKVAGKGRKSAKFWATHPVVADFGQSNFGPN